MFLQDTIPSPLSLSDALQRREAKEKELLEEDPAISTSLSVSLSGSYTSKGKGRGRMANGKEKLNGSTSSNRRDSRSRDTKGRWSYDFHPGSTRADSAEGSWTPCTWSDERATFRPTSAQMPAQNGVEARKLSPLPDPFVPARPHIVVPRDGRPELAPPSHNPHPASAFLAANETWPGQYTGPASGFLQDPRGSFGRVSPNPGRTIYSPHHFSEPGSYR